MFSEYTLTVTFLNRYVVFNVQTSQFLHYAFPQVLINYTGHWSTIILSSHAISAGIEWVTSYFSWLRIIFLLVQCSLLCAQSFSTVSSHHLCSIHILMIINNSCRPYLYFIQRYLIITFFSYRNAILHCNVNKKFLPKYLNF